MPPSSGWALDTAEKRAEKSEVSFIAQWHLASEGLRLGSTRKAELLKRSMKFGLGALIFLALSFPAGIIENRVPGLESPDHLEGKTGMNDSTNNQSDNSNSAPNPATQPQTPTASGQPGPQMIDRSAVPTVIQATQDSSKGISEE